MFALVLGCAAPARASESDTAAGQHKVIGIKEPGKSQPVFKRTGHPDAQWFADAGLGLFIHWGISSVHGDLELSWAMMSDVPWDKDNRHTITPREYFRLADRFNPDQYDPDQWLRAARAAGFAYAVLTTRHHDGYALWPSKVGEFGTRTHMGGRDLIRPYVEACQKNGLKVGFYYSPPDWYYNRDYMSFRYSGEPYGLNHEVIALPRKPEGWDDAYKAYVRTQVEELLTQYGKIDVMWFDGGPEAISIERIRHLQPSIVINNRMHGHGDFLTPEWDMPKERPVGWWENCASWIEGWGYRSTERYQTTGWMLSRLVQVRAWGGNLLLNVGPRPDGRMPKRYFERMDEVAAWMKHSGRSVVGTSPCPSPEKANVPVTTRPDAWYLHALPDFREPVVLKDVNRPTSLTLLRTRENAPFEFSDGTLRFSIPEELRTTLVDVVELRW